MAAWVEVLCRTWAEGSPVVADDRVVGRMDSVVLVVVVGSKRVDEPAARPYLLASRLMVDVHRD